MRHARGYVTLVSVLILGAVGVAIAVALLVLGLGASRTAFVAEQSASARALADSCTEEALEQIQQSNTYTGTASLTIGQGSCTYTVTSQGSQNRTVTASGAVGTVVRKVKIVITKITPSFTFSTWQEVADF
ncbi:MAG TPA: hypothetical protein VF829_03175 [Candidatus Paceibacterota bacterium]